MSASGRLLSVMLVCSLVAYSTGLKCYSCTDCGKGQVETPVDCSSLQGACLKVVLEERIEKSCTPTLACSLGDAEKGLTDFFSSVTGNDKPTSDDRAIHCCDTDLCNGATAAHPATALLLLTPLLLSALLRQH